MNKNGCHSKNPLVFDTGKVKVYAGGTNRDGGWHRMTILPDLAMGPRGVIASKMTQDLLPKGWKSTDALIGGGNTIVMEIDWPDYGIPTNLGPSWWSALVEDIEEKGITTISTQCMGGHGRTGVQLAILAHKMLPEKDHTWKNAGELITFIRDSYCTHAVESKQQQTYVADCCGIPEGESVITVQTNAWSNIDYDDSMILTPDEIEAQILEDERKEAKKVKAAAKRARDKQSKKGRKGNGKPKSHTAETKYDSPIKKGWSLTNCSVCNEYEWRRAWQNDMEWPCRTCGSAVNPCDDELSSNNRRFRTAYCEEYEMDFHPIEMYNNHISIVAEAHSRGMRTRVNGGYDWEQTQVRIGSKWHATCFIVEEGGKFVPHHIPYNEKRKAEKEERRPKRDHRHLAPLHTESTPKQYRDWFGIRESNEEIEQED
mgnify:FL=1